MAEKFTQRSEKPERRGSSPNSRKNLRPFKKGQSGNPGGKPGTDLAAVAARRFFEAHPEIGAKMARELKGFNAYAFAVLADRGYGKVKDDGNGTKVGPQIVIVNYIPRPKRG